MDKYLLEILKNANTIIIPGLGALTITNPETGEIMFMSYLKHDDGKLTSYIIENEGFEELEAKNLIAKYVREIELTISKGESYDMYQFGSFYKNGDEVDFRNWDKGTEAPKEKKPAVVKKEEPTSEENAAQVVEEKENVFVEKPKNEETLIKVEGEKAGAKMVDDTAETKRKELNILEKEEQLKHVEKLAALKKAQEDKNRKKVAKQKVVKEKGEKQQRGVGFWMLIGLIVLMLAGGTYFGLNYEELKQHIPFLADKEAAVKTNETVNENDTSSEDETNNENVTESEEDTLPIEEDNAELTEDVELSIEQEVETPVAQQYSGGDLPFHVIAGAFSSEENARRLGDKFASEGYTVKVGPGRGMTLVSIKSFATREEAQRGLNELKGTAPNGWIYEWK